MTNSKNKFSRKLIAVALSVMMLIAMAPATVLTSAWGSTDPTYDYLAVQGLTATYVAEDDSICVSWTAVDGAVDALSLTVNNGEAVALAADATSYTAPAAAYAGKTVAVALTAVCGEEGRTAEASVAVPATLTNVRPIPAMYVDNHTALSDILQMLPSVTPVTVEGTDKPVTVPVTWSANGIAYDRALATEQTVVISGHISLPDSIRNRNGADESASVNVIVQAATDISIKTDLDANTQNKLAGESLILSVEVEGTAVSYQWYCNGTAIEGACSETLHIADLTPAHSGNYYCYIIGKNQSTAISRIATVNVAKCDTAVGVAVVPKKEQSRPAGITLQAVGVPADAQGTLTFMANDAVVGTVNLPATTIDFRAASAVDTYVFTVIYSGDDAHYNGSTSDSVNYNFNKGAIFVSGINNATDLTGVAGHALQLMAPTATLYPLPQSNVTITYTYEVDNTAIAEVDANGLLTYKQKGECNLIITATANEDYNACSFVIPVKVELDGNRGLYFTETGSTTAYKAGFSYVIPYINGSKGNGELSVSITAKDDYAEMPQYLVATLDTENNQIVITYDPTIDAADANLNKVLTGEVAVTLTKAADGVYNAISATYMLTINKGKQGYLYFPAANISVVYDPDNNTHALQEPKGDTVNTVNSDIVYSAEPDESGNKLIALSTEDNTFTTLRSGNVKITATKPGNSLYEDASCTYAVYILQGKVKDFGFATKEDNSAVFGVPYNNNTLNGSTQNVKYFFNYVDPAFKDASGNIYGIKLNEASGEITFEGNYFKVPSKSTYKFGITAVRAEDECFEQASASYELVINRAAVYAEDYGLIGAEKQPDNSILSTFGNVNSTEKGITIQPLGDYTAIYAEKNGNEVKWDENLFLDAQGEYDLAFYLKKESGEVSQRIVVDVVLDTSGSVITIAMEDNYFVDEEINSVWTGFTSSLSFNLWKESSKKITVTTEDTYSNIHEVYYSVQTENFVSLDKEEITMDDILAVVDGFEWTQCENMTSIGRHKGTASFILDLSANTNMKAVVYVMVTDVAGNVSYARTDGVVFDNIAPTYEIGKLPDSIISITLPEPNGEVGLYNGDVPFNVTVNDADTDGIAAGIDRIKVTISGTGSNENDLYQKVINVTVDANSNGKDAEQENPITSFRSEDIGLPNFPTRITVDNTFIIPGNFNSNYLSVLVEVWDRAGNYCSNKNDLTYLAIDSVQPHIQVVYNDEEVNFTNEKYLGNNQNREATILITELNFDSRKVDFSNILLDGKTLPVSPTFFAEAYDAHGDVITWKAVVDFTEDGDYSFNISCTDLATNEDDGWSCKSEYPTKYWTIDNTKPTIHVAMSNSNVNNGMYFSDDRLATVTITERNFESKEVDWTGITYSLDGYKMPNGAPAAKLVTSDDKTYERVYTISFTTEGEYTFDVDYTDLAGNQAEAYVCRAVSHREFIIDKTAPEIDILNVADQTAYNGTVEPVINYSDRYRGELTPSIRLTGVKNGVVNFTPAKEDYTSYGKKLTYSNFAYTKDTDDIYTLSVTMADMAGNLTSKTISFSVNRFGSTYDLSALEDILGKYLREEQDIVFTETNVNELDHETLLIKVIKNGTPTALVEGEDYTVEKTGGDGLWSVYKYTIKKELFSTDGYYTISIYSVDGAGNVNENDDETKQAEIAFTIDKTAPVIVPIDFEDDTPYAEDPKTVTVEIKDNLLLDDVKILLNGEEIDYTVDGDNYTFDIPQSNSKQDAEIVAVDAAGNEYPIEVKNFLVNTNLFVRWFNNTPLFIGSLAGVVLLILVLTSLALFGKKKDAKK